MRYLGICIWVVRLLNSLRLCVAWWGPGVFKSVCTWCEVPLSFLRVCFLVLTLRYLEIIFNVKGIWIFWHLSPKIPIWSIFLSVFKNWVSWSLWTAVSMLLNVWYQSMFKRKELTDLLESVVSMLIVRHWDCVPNVRCVRVLLCPVAHIGISSIWEVLCSISSYRFLRIFITRFLRLRYLLDRNSQCSPRLA